MAVRLSGAFKKFTGGLKVGTPAAADSYSVLFDGTNDYVTTAYSTTFFDWSNSSGNDWTIEFWVYPTNASKLSYTTDSDHNILIGNRLTDNNDFWSFGINGGTLDVQFFYWSGAANKISSGLTASLNAWNHIGFTKTNSGVSMFCNGSIASATFPTGIQSSNSQPLSMGVGNGLYFEGNMSNLRISDSAVYTGASYSVPSSPLTSDAGTWLLTFNSDTIVDNSSNSRTMNSFGGVSTSTSDPFE